jgi:Uncharacterized protein conserved in bacteria
MDITEYTKIRNELIGHKFRHFKGHEIIIKDITVDTENEEYRVIYHHINNPDIIWDRPYSMFTSKVDKEKYPNVEQEYRFERIDGE